MSFIFGYYFLLAPPCLPPLLPAHIFLFLLRLLLFSGRLHFLSYYFGPLFFALLFQLRPKIMAAVFILLAAYIFLFLPFIYFDFSPPLFRRIYSSAAGIIFLSAAAKNNERKEIGLLFLFYFRAISFYFCCFSVGPKK